MFAVWHTCMILSSFVNLLNALPVLWFSALQLGHHADSLYMLHTLYKSTVLYWYGFTYLVSVLLIFSVIKKMWCMWYWSSSTDISWTHSAYAWVHYCSCPESGGMWKMVTSFGRLAYRCEGSETVAYRCSHSHQPALLTFDANLLQPAYLFSVQVFTYVASTVICHCLSVMSL